MLVCYPETAVPADNCAIAGRSNVCVKESVQLARLELCRRAITIQLHALELRAVDVSTTFTGIKVEGVEGVVRLRAET